MKRVIKKAPFFALLVFAILLTGCASIKTAGDDKLPDALGKLLEEKEFFVFKEEFLKNEKRLTSRDRLYFKEILFGLQGKPELSNRAIAKLLSSSDTTDPSLILNLLQDKLRNHQKEHRYADALETSRDLLRNHVDELSAHDRDDIANAVVLWQCIADVPAPQAKKRGDASFAVKKDAAGLPTIEVVLPSGKTDFVIDTGANYSVLQRSVAEKWGLPIKNIDFLVGTGTDRKVPCNIAVADHLELGTITLKHVVFLVIDDEALRFPSTGYEIKGILGFPEMQSLEEIRFTHHRTELFVPAVAQKYKEENLMYAGLMPLVLVKKGNDTLTFAFDTGAVSTILHPPFYKKYEREITENYTRSTFEVGGAGGTMRVEGFQGVSAKLSVGSATGSLTGLPLIIDDKIDFSHKECYGLLGQDFINHFDEMIISFKYSSLILR